MIILHNAITFVDMFTREKTRRVIVGNVPIGGNSPISVQSMTKVPTVNVRQVLRQIEQCRQAGCDIIRISVPDEKSAQALFDIVRKSPLPVVADIHFDYKLALMSIKAGVRKIRINPGNIGAEWKVREVAISAKDSNVPIRIGVNSGSIPRDLLKKYRMPVPQALVESAEREIELLSKIGFEDIVVSLKSANISDTLESCVLFAQKYDFPQHIGITESGFGDQGIIASSVGIGIILNSGIGNTIRVSLSGHPRSEVIVGREILQILGLRDYGIRLISCPMCARSHGDVFVTARKVWRKISGMNLPITVAIMGCEVNGPGEAKFADIGVAFGRDCAVVFKNGRTVKRLRGMDVADILIEEIIRLAEEKNCAISSGLFLEKPNSMKDTEDEAKNV